MDFIKKIFMDFKEMDLKVMEWKHVCVIKYRNKAQGCTVMTNILHVDIGFAGLTGGTS